MILDSESDGENCFAYGLGLVSACLSFILVFIASVHQQASPRNSGLPSYPYVHVAPYITKGLPGLQIAKVLSVYIRPSPKTTSI